jgi:hypothetical protein
MIRIKFQRAVCVCTCLINGCFSRSSHEPNPAFT